MISILKLQLRIWFLSIYFQFNVIITWDICEIYYLVCRNKGKGGLDWSAPGCEPRGHAGGTSGEPSEEVERVKVADYPRQSDYRCRLAWPQIGRRVGIRDRGREIGTLEPKQVRRRVASVNRNM